MSEYVEAVVAQVEDLKNGEMKECNLGGGQILLVKDEDKFFALGAKCTHYGAKLATGVYCQGRVRCPWHGAVYKVDTGDIEDFPSFGALPSFEVKINGKDVVVRAQKDRLESDKKLESSELAYDNKDTRVFVIIGGGAAGHTAAETLRAEGFTGRVVVICKEKLLPYDRTKLSKAMDSEAAKITIRDEEFWKRHNVEMLREVECVELDADAKTIKLSNGETLKYDKALAATGGEPQKLAFLPGHDGKNVYLLRNLDHAHTILKESEGKNVVIVGSSFIGMEVASCLVKKAKSVTVVGMEKVPFERVLGEKIGKIMQQMHEGQGIKFKLSANVAEFKKSGDTVTAIVLKDDDDVPADIVVLGAGVTPACRYIKESSSIKRDEKDKSVFVNKFLESGAPGLYAAGDIAKFPLKLLGDEPVRIEHWAVAQTAGFIAAKNMMHDNKHPYESVPVFWTAQYGKSFRYCGHAKEFDDVVVDSEETDINPDNPKFVAYYVQKGQVVAVLSVQRDPIVSQVSELMRVGEKIEGAEIKEALKNDKSTSGFIRNKLDQVKCKA